MASKTQSPFAAAVQAEYATLTEKRDAELLRKAEAIAAHKLREAKRAEWTVDEWAEKLAPHLILPEKVWPDMPALGLVHSSGAPSLRPPVVRADHWRLDDQGIWMLSSLGTFGGGEAKFDPFWLCSPCFPLRRPAVNQQGLWAVKVGSKWKTVETGAIELVETKTDKRNTNYAWSGPSENDVFESLKAGGVRFSQVLWLKKFNGEPTVENASEGVSVRSVFGWLAADVEQESKG